MRDSKLTALSAALIALCFSPVAVAQDGFRPNLDRARAVFARLTALDRNEVTLELMATGDFNGMASGQLGPRLYDAIASFQARQRLDSTGVLDRDTRGALGDEGARIFNSWGFEFLDHPTAQASVVVPARFNFTRSQTPRGYALATRNGTMNIDFSFFPDKDAGLDQVFSNLTRLGPDRQMAFQVLRPTFLAVSGTAGAKLFYARWIVVPDGVAGFTLSWNPDAYPNASRIATVMANELYPRRMLEGNGGAPSLAQAMPGDRDGADAPRADRDGASGRTPLNDGMEGVSQEALSRMQRDKAERERLAREAAAVRSKLEEQRAIQAAADEAARVAYLDGLAVARLKRLQTAATKQLDEAARFVRDNQDPHRAAILGAIDDLRGAVSGADPRSIEAKTAALMAALNDTPAYVADVARRRAEEARRNACNLAEARHLLVIQRQFLIEAASRDPLSGTTRRFMALYKQSSDPSASADVDRATTIVAQIDQAIADANLQSSFAVSKADAERGALGGGEADAACAR